MRKMVRKDRETAREERILSGQTSNGNGGDGVKGDSSKEVCGTNPLAEKT